MANMTTEEVLGVIRQNIGQAIQEVQGECPIYLDEFLLKYVMTANFTLQVLGVVTGVSVSTTTISPDPSVAIGMLLASSASASIIGDDMLHRLRNGELGLSFSSGATSISTNQAAINLKGSAENLFTWRDLLLTAYLSGDPNAVLSRLESSNAS